MPLPDFKVKESPKAKNLRLRVTPEEGLSVIVPRGFDLKRLPAILKKKRCWIDDALEKAKARKRFFEPKPTAHLPDRIELRAIGEVWPVNYCWDGTRTGVSLRSINSELVLSGNQPDRNVVITKLKGWLRQRVRDSLFPLARELARKHRLPVRELFVKSQRTRWASCSSSHNLALNTKLLFVEPDLVRYVLIHELCHTVQLNHSKEFWHLVACYEPHYRVLDRKIRDAWKTVPQWVF